MYNFKEAILGPNFAQDKLKEFRTLIDTGLSFVVISMPGVGVSYFLKYLATQDFAYFVHVDLYSLPTLSQHEFYKLLLSELGGKPFDFVQVRLNRTQGKSGSKTDPDLSRLNRDLIGTDGQILLETKEILKKLAEKQSKIVLIFSRFDQLCKSFDWNFLSNIQSLTAVSPGKIVLIFTSTKPLYEIVPLEALSGGNLNFYSENLYFKPYSKNDLQKLCAIEPARPGLAKPALDKLLGLSGGHNQLLHILLSSQKQNNLLLDRFVRLQMKELVDYLNYYQRKTLQKVALGRNVTEIDDYLLGVGMVKKIGTSFKLFTPLLTDYIKTNLPVKLPVKEAKLFKLLRKNMGKTVSKDEIFTEVWGENNQDATDWALDALIYRLRKHPFMQAHGFIIESQKKVGYTLIQS